LNPDEGIHVCRSQHSDWLSNVATNGTAPPLFFFLVHYLQLLSKSELIVRLPFVLSGCIFPWLIYKWLQRLGLPVAALCSFLILELGPNLVALTSQVRGYAIALLFLALALYFLEEAIEFRSFGRLIASSVFLDLGILTEFSSAFGCAALAIYGLARMYFADFKVREPFLFAWAGTQIGAVGVYLLLYQFMMSDLLSRSIVSSAIGGYLRRGFPMPGESLAYFALKGAAKQFSYLAGSIPGGGLCLLFFLIGLVAIWRPQSDRRFDGGRAWSLAVVAAFGCATLAAAVGAFPFGRTRHSVLLGLLLTPVVAIGVQSIVGRIPRFALGALISLPILFAAMHEPDPQNIARSVHQLNSMQEAIRLLETKIPSGATVLSDDETVWMLSYYLSGRTCPAQPQRATDFHESIIASRSFITNRWGYRDWDDAQADAKQLREQRKIPAGERIFILHGGFDGMSGNTPGAESLAGVFILAESH